MSLGFKTKESINYREESPSFFFSQGGKPKIPQMTGVKIY